MENFHLVDHKDNSSRRCVWVNGPVIVGAGPSGLATAACLRGQGIPFLVLEKENCLASLWQKRTYDRLKLQLPKHFCQLPKLPFPEDFPESECPTKTQFIEYIESYAKHFDINPQFNECVQSARYNEASGLWTVKTIPFARGGSTSTRNEVEYICRWLVVATGENAESVIPEIEGLAEFKGDVIHACDYKSGESFRGKKVLVVGCGRSGTEISLDLCNHHASPSMVVRSSVHVLPREIYGKSTFELVDLMQRWLPLWLVDKFLLISTWFVLGSIDNYGLKRPSAGPLEGKILVLDIGTVEKIRSGDIKVVPGIKKFNNGEVELVNGQKLDIDAVVLATGYRSNVPSWLRKVNSSPRMDTQRCHSLMAGKEMQGFMLWGSHREGSMVLHLMLRILLKILAKFGNKRQSKGSSTLLLALDIAFSNSTWGVHGSVQQRKLN